MADDFDIIASYTLDQALDDGVLVTVFKNRWQQLSDGKPIVATGHLFGEVSLAALQEIWNAYAHWKTHVESTLPEEDRLFSMSMNSKKVWVIEDAQAITLMYPDDY